MKTALKILFTPSLWSPIYDYNKEWDKKLNELMDKYRGELHIYFNYNPHILFGGEYVVHSRSGFLIDGDYCHRPSRKTLIELRERTNKLIEEDTHRYYTQL